MIERVKLITWEQFQEKFETKSDVFVVYNDFRWFINRGMKKLFGGYIEVIRIYNMTTNYTHVGTNGNKQLWHELWFEPEFEDFIKEEEMIIT